VPPTAAAGASLAPRDRLIAALDVPDVFAAARLASAVAPEVGMLKVGLELFVAEGPPVVEKARALAPVFLDLKLYDIPATVERAARAAARLGARLLTVHPDPDGATLRAAVQGAGDVTGILCVTLLTSISDEQVRTTGLAASAEDLVVRHAWLAVQAGCAGVVCSAQEAARVRRECGAGLQIVTPGIRPDWAAAPGDQARVATPAEALRAGADRLVVGRPIRDAVDPRAAARRIVEEIAEARPAR
jgi:orotidine-5'-phosphate decarboxylase